jgi:hypothetical protein
LGVRLITELSTTSERAIQRELKSHEDGGRVFKSGDLKTETEGGKEGIFYKDYLLW